MILVVCRHRVGRLCYGFRQRVLRSLVGLLDLNRFESLGENCEFGFLMLSHEFSSGGFFRWAFTPLHALIHLLKQDFRSVYRFENLRSRFGSMVQDSKYDVLFHSLLRSHVNPEGVAEFLGSDEEQDKIYRQEKEKIDYLVDKFRRRLRRRNLIFVLKRNELPPAEQFDLLMSVLKPILQETQSYLLMVTPCLTSCHSPGRVEWAGANLLRGYVAFMAPGESANQLDYVNWNVLILKSYWMTLPPMRWCFEVIDYCAINFIRPFMPHRSLKA